jgi:heme/copper-type cytochrome/quinol oxidase subunit 4
MKPNHLLSSKSKGIIISLFVSVITTLLVSLFSLIKFNLVPREHQILFFPILLLIIIIVFIVIYFPLFRKSYSYKKNLLKLLFTILIQIIMILSSIYFAVNNDLLSWAVPSEYYKKSFSEEELVDLLESYNNAIRTFAYYRIQERIEQGENLELYLELLWNSYYQNVSVDSGVIDILRLIAIGRDKRLFPILDQMLASNEAMYSSVYFDKNATVSFKYRSIAVTFYKEYFDKQIDVDTTYNMSFESEDEMLKYVEQINSSQKTIPIWK